MGRYQNLAVSDIRLMLRRRGLVTEGKKIDLIHRLIEFDAKKDKEEIEEERKEKEEGEENSDGEKKGGEKRNRKDIKEQGEGEEEEGKEDNNNHQGGSEKKKRGREDEKEKQEKGKKGKIDESREYIKSNRHIIGLIFSYIPHSLNNCASVSKTWRSICLEEQFAWFSLCTPWELVGLFQTNQELNFENKVWNNIIITRKTHSVWGAQPVFINICRLQKLIESGQPIDSFLWKFARAKWTDILHAMSKNKCTATSVIPPKISQPLGMSGQIKLYNYQLQAIEWMAKIEKDLGPEKYMPDTMVWKTRNGMVFFHDERKEIYINPHEDFQEVYFPRGGVLADEMGLGKTAEIVGLILLMPSTITPTVPSPPNFADYPPLAPPEKILRQKQKFLSFLNKTKKKVATKRKTPIQSVKNEEFANVDLSVLLLPTRATLVLCPPHLVAQWKSEIDLYTNSGLKIVVLSVVSDLGEITYRDIFNAEVVIVSSQIILHPNYFHIGHTTPASSVRKDEPRVRPNWVKRYLLELYAEKETLLDNIAPVLDHFHWHRIVIDESHEISSTGIDVMFNIKTNTIWCVSGTPFPDESQLFTVMQILGFPDSAVHQFANKYVWRNTKLSVKKEYETPEFVEETFGLDLSPVERIAYRQYFSGDPLCPDLNLIGINSSSPVLLLLADSMIAASKASVKETVDRMRLQDDPKYAISRIRQLISNIAHLSTIDLTYPDVLPASLMSGVSDKALAKIIEEINDLKPLQETYGKEIKGDEISDAETDETTQGDDLHEAPELTPDDVKTIFVEHFGTKIGNLIFYLKNLWESDPSARVLIFSSFKDLLRRLQKCLSTVGISSGKVAGNAVARTRVISKFKHQELKLRVLLLEYNVAAAGTNLIEASHIFLMDGATKENTHQAIARAHRQGQRKNIKVVRFYTKNTIDHRWLVDYKYIEEPYNTEVEFKIPPDGKIDKTSDLANFIRKNVLPRFYPELESCFS